MEDHLAELADVLTRARRQAVARVAEFEATERGFAEARGDADGDDEHDPEGSTLSWERAAAAAAVGATRRHLAEIDAALDRVAAGWDGTCAGCGRPIPAERLAVRPSADRCTACAARG